MDIYAECAKLTAEKSVIEAKLEKVREKIYEKMLKDNTFSVEHALGKFTIEEKKKWTYPESVKKLESKFKLAKVEAEEKGTATCEVNTNLKFSPIKI